MKEVEEKTRTIINNPYSPGAGLRPVAVRGLGAPYDMFWMEGVYSNYMTINTNI